MSYQPKIIIPAIMLLLFVPSVTLAQNNPESDTEPAAQEDLIDRAKEKKNGSANNDDRVNQKLQYKCSTSSSKMDKLETRYRKVFEKHKSSYLNITGRVSEMLDELEDKGYDTENAREANLSFIAQIEATQNDYDSFESEFQYARERLCEDDVSGFRESLQQSRNQLRVLRNNMLQFRGEFQNSVKPELHQLREQIRERAQEDQNDGDSEQ